MSLEKHSMKPKGNLRKMMKTKMHRPFPLVWGFAALFLFALFAVVTQLQFTRISNEKIYQARIDTYQSDLVAYQVAEKAHSDCVASIEVRETYRGIFSGISNLFQKTADLPARLFPFSEEAISYQEQLTDQIDDLITKPVADNLPHKEENDCPQIQNTKPAPPSR